MTHIHKIKGGFFVHHDIDPLTGKPWEEGEGPKPVLKPGIIYAADNGRLICLTCAGAAAKFTGRDISGQCVEAMTARDAAEWEKQLGKPMACESGCTTYTLGRLARD